MGFQDDLLAFLHEVFLPPDLQYVKQLLLSCVFFNLVCVTSIETKCVRACVILKSWEQIYGNVFMKGWLSKLAIDRPLLRYFVMLTV